MKQLLHILKYKFIAYIKFETKVSFSSLFKSFSSLLIYGGFGVGAFFFSKSLIRFLLIDIKVGMFLLHQFISIVLFIFFISVNVGNIIVAHSTLFKSDDVTFFMSKPVNPSKIFLIKFLDNFFYSSSTLFIIIVSVLAGYASYFHLSVTSFLIIIVFNFLPFIITAGSLGVLILLLIIRLSAKFGVKQVIYSMVILYLLTVILFFNLNSPVKLVNSVMYYYPLVNKDKFLNYLLPSFTKYLPNNWLAITSYWITLGQVSEALKTTIYQVGLSAFLFGLTYFLGKRWYFQTWLLNLRLSSENRRRIDDERSKKVLFGFLKPSILKPQIEAILKRDFLLFFREPVQVIHLSVLLILIGIFISSVSGIKFVGLGNFYLQASIYLSFFLFNMLLISTLSLRFVFPAMSLEGLGFWKIKSAPIKNNIFIRLKILPQIIIIVLVGLLLSVLSNLKFNSHFLYINVLLTLAASLSLIAVNFGMGSVYTNYKEKNAIRIASSQGASISFLFNIFYMLFVIAFMFRPVSDYFLSVMIKRPFNYSIFYLPVVSIIILSTLIVFFFSRMVITSMKRDL